MVAGLMPYCASSACLLRALQAQQNTLTCAAEPITPKIFTSCDFFVFLRECIRVPELPDAAQRKIIRFTFDHTGEIEIFCGSQIRLLVQIRKQGAGAFQDTDLSAEYSTSNLLNSLGMLQWDSLSVSPKAPFLIAPRHRADRRYVSTSLSSNCLLDPRIIPTGAIDA
jgi:hypothetical protein